MFREEGGVAMGYGGGWFVSRLIRAVQRMEWTDDLVDLNWSWSVEDNASMNPVKKATIKAMSMDRFRREVKAEVGEVVILIARATGMQLLINEE